MVEEAINSDLMSIDRWIGMWKATADVVNFTCDNTTLPLRSQIGLLWVTVDNKLKFENPTRGICRKVSLETKKDIYFSFILSNLNYCSEVWNHCSKRCGAKLEKVQLMKEHCDAFFSDYILLTLRYTTTEIKISHLRKSNKC